MTVRPCEVFRAPLPIVASTPCEECGHAPMAHGGGTFCTVCGEVIHREPGIWKLDVCGECLRKLADQGREDIPRLYAVPLLERETIGQGRVVFKLFQEGTKRVFLVILYVYGKRYPFMYRDRSAGAVRKWAENLLALAAGHTKDEDCTVIDGECVFCGVDHSEPCEVCGGAGFHRPGCEVMK